MLIRSEFEQNTLHHGIFILWMNGDVVVLIRTIHNQIFKVIDLQLQTNYQPFPLSLHKPLQSLTLIMFGQY